MDQPDIFNTSVRNIITVGMGLALLPLALGLLALNFRPQFEPIFAIVWQFLCHFGRRGVCGYDPKAYPIVIAVFFVTAFVFFVIAIFAPAFKVRTDREFGD